MPSLASQGAGGAQSSACCNQRPEALASQRSNAFEKTEQPNRQQHGVVRLDLPILTDESHNIIAGHGRLEAAKLLQFQQVPIIEMVGLSETQKRLLALADNKIAANAGYDRAMLAAELGDLAIVLPECDHIAYTLHAVSTECARSEAAIFPDTSNRGQP